MRIFDLRIENFRGIRNGRVRFGRHSVLVGANNSGKTTVIEALVLLFGRDRLLRTLTEHDFYGGRPDAADRIRIIATIAGFEPNLPSEHRDWFMDGRAIEKWYDETTGELNPEQTTKHGMLAMQLAFCARFDLPSLEVETIRYFYDDDSKGDPFDDDGPPTIPRALIQELGFFLVPANRTWDAVISFGSELFRRIVTTEKAQPYVSVIAERDRLRDPEGPLETDKGIAPIVANLDQELEGFFRSKPRLRLRLTSTDSDGVLDAVIPHYQFADTPLPLPARRHGSGLISLQRVLLLLHLGRQRAAGGQNFWMALEEPELHVPPPLQRRLVNRLQALTAQTFVSTHSPMVATLADPTTVTILRNDSGVLSAVPLRSGPLPDVAANSIRTLFQLNRLETITAVMHDVVLVPEGRIDKEWIDLLVRAVDANQGWNRDDECRFGSYVGLIATHDGAVIATCKALREIHSRIVALVDGDDAGVRYAKDLVAQEPPPTAVLRWPDGWAIEDVIGWVLSADAPRAIIAVDGVLEAPVSSVGELVARLKSLNRAELGLKQNYVAYEAIAAVIGDIKACADRARDALNAISDSAVGGKTEMFVPDTTLHQAKVFRP